MSTTLRATHIGAIAAEALTADRLETAAEVTAAFPHSFYVKTADGDLLFFNGRQLKSPITINLNSSINLEQVVKPRDPVVAQKNEVRIGRITSIRLESAERSLIRAPQAHQLILNRELLDLASLVLVVIDNNLSVLDPVGMAHPGAVDFVSQGIIPLRISEDPNQFLTAARRIVGLGGGFTPSGDDLLGGFLASYNSFAEDMGRQIILLDSESLQAATTWTSAKLLDYMQRRVLDDQVSSLISTAALGDTDGFLGAMEELLPRGHTSGIDILVGAILGLSLISDIKSEAHATVALSERLGL